MAKDNGTLLLNNLILKARGMHALIVRDVQKQWHCSAAFFRFPQDDLYVVAFTGTKGKTTSAYFLKDA